MNVEYTVFAQSNSAQNTLPTEKIIIHSQETLSLTAQKHSFCVEIADEPSERKKGLMFRARLSLNSGMLFLYENPDIHAMWMKNTPLSLDMLFIDSKGEIIHIAENTTPFSQDVITPPKPVLAVLELKAGAVRTYALKTGYSIHHSSFGQNAALKCDD